MSPSGADMTGLKILYFISKLCSCSCVRVYTGLKTNIGRRVPASSKKKGVRSRTVIAMHFKVIFMCDFRLDRRRVLVLRRYVYVLVI